MRPRGSKLHVPAPLVWLLAASMVLVGLFAASGALRAPEGEDGAQGPQVVAVDLSTPERSAESFLDAWRKRDHRAAGAASSGEAHELVQSRQAADGRLSAQERSIKSQVWDAMAADRLQLRVRESQDLDDGALALRGTAEGTFLDQPYVREVEFTLTPDGQRWLVADFQFGRITSGAELAIDELAPPGDSE